MSKHIIERNPAVVDAALADYKNPELTVEAIALKHKVSSASLTGWAKRHSVPLRNRGRRTQLKPTTRQLEIIKMASVYKYDQVGARFGMHKQSVHRIVKRWRNYVSPHEPPFTAGDVVFWRRKKFTVVEASLLSGTLVDDHGKFYKNFVWSGNRFPKKIGVDAKFQVKRKV